MSLQARLLGRLVEGEREAHGRGGDEQNFSTACGRPTGSIQRSGAMSMRKTCTLRGLAPSVSMITTGMNDEKRSASFDSEERILRQYDSYHRLANIISTFSYPSTIGL